MDRFTAVTREALKHAQEKSESERLVCVGTICVFIDQVTHEVIFNAYMPVDTPELYGKYAADVASVRAHLSAFLTATAEDIQKKSDAALN